MSQTSYAAQFGPPYQGLLADLAVVRDAISKINTDSVELPFGTLLAQDASNDYGVKLLAASTDKLAGIGVFTFAHDPNNLLTAQGAIKVGGQIAVLTKGRIWVPVEQDVGPTDPVYARYATGAGGSTRGAFRKDADTSTAVLIKGAFFVAAATAAGGLACVQFDLNASKT